MREVVQRYRARKQQLRKLLSVITHVSLGVHKRIDENRELLQVLQRDCPEFLKRNPWVVGWIERQDEFLTEIVRASGGAMEAFGAGSAGYPRPWPG